MLYDRNDELSKLNDTFRQICCGQLTQKEIVMIIGPSGVGKTALANRLQESVDSQKGHFVSGKFDPLSSKCCSTKSYAPFVAAFTQFAKQVIARGDERRVVLCTQIQKELSSVEIAIVMAAIPAIRELFTPQEIVEQSSSDTSRRGSDANDCFVSIFSRFVSACCCGGQPPMVLFLDDIQWANSESLELLTALGTDHVGSKMMIVCGFREGDCARETGDTPASFHTIISDIEGEGGKVTTLVISNMRPVAVDDMISDFLDLPKKLCFPLSEMIYRITNGNPFFVWQVLRSLQQDKLLTKDDSGSWQWNETQIFVAMQTQSVQQLLASKVQKLPVVVRTVLKIASCLGTAFQSRLISVASDNLSIDEVDVALQRAEDDGIVVTDVGCLRFAHDNIQETVYAMIPESERPEEHLKLGCLLMKKLPPDAFEEHVLLVAEQVCRGIQLVDSQYDKKVYAELFLRAALKAAISSSFTTSAALLNKGIGLLSGRCWQDYYNLSLNLYSTAAEIEYYNGNLDRVDRLVSVVFKKAKKFEDTLRARFTRVYSLGSRGATTEAMNESLSVLEQLGFRFPKKKVGKLYLIAILLQCKHLLRYKDVRNQPVMQDRAQLTAMRLTILLGGFAFYSRTDLSFLCAVRLVSFPLRYGMNDMCCAGFAGFSLMYALKGDVKQAERYGQLAVQLYHESGAKEWQARVALCVHGGAFPMTHRHRDLLEPLLTAHRTCRVLGDIHFSVMSALVYSRLALSSGINISNVLKDTFKFRDISNKFHMHLSTSIETVLQLLLNLKGKSKDPLVLTGDALNEDEALRRTKETDPPTYVQILMYKHMMAVLMNNLTVSQEISQRIRFVKGIRVLPVMTYMHTFFEGLAAARLSKSLARHKKVARTLITKLKGYAHHNPCNYLNKVYLVEAELAACSGNFDEAIQKCQLSITCARQYELIHEEALACEVMGNILSDNGKLEDAVEYYRIAISCYSQWGAQIKVEHLQNYINEQPCCPIPSSFASHAD